MIKSLMVGILIGQSMLMVDILHTTHKWRQEQEVYRKMTEDSLRTIYEGLAKLPTPPIEMPNYYPDYWQQPSKERMI